MKNINVKMITRSGVFLALGLILPFFTSQIKEIGDTLLPMHLPVMLCGLVCGPFYGLFVGVVLPVLRSFLFSMPPIYPNAIWMACELCTYGFVIGFLYRLLPKGKILSLYISLVVSMISGRIVWGIAKTILLGLADKSFTFAAFISGGFLDASLGILLQLVLIPLIMGIMGEFKNKND